MSTDGYGLAKNVEDMLVAELKDILLQNNLSTVGKKLELVSRLKDHLNDQQPLKRKADDNDENGEESNKKQKTESSAEHEEEKEEIEVENNEEEVEYQEVGIQGEYQENHEYQHGNEDNEEVVVEEVGAGRELYPEEKEEQEEKERNEERNDETSQSQDGNDSKESTSGLNKIPTLSLNNNRPNQNNQGYARLPPLRDQIKVALDDKNFEELDKLTKILLSQNDQLNKKLSRTLQGNDELLRNFQAQGAAFTREKIILHQIIRERDEALRRMGGMPTPIRPGGPTGPPMSRPPMKSTMPIPQPQPIRAIPPTGQRYGQMPPVPRPSSNYTQLPLAPQQQQQSNYRPAYSANSYQQQQPSHQQQYQSSHQASSSYQRKY